MKDPIFIENIIGRLEKAEIAIADRALQHQKNVKRLETLEQNVTNLKLQTREYDYDGTHPEAIREQIDAANSQLEELSTRIRTLEKAREADRLKQDVERDAKAEVKGRGAKWGYGRSTKESPKTLAESFGAFKLDLIQTKATPENLEVMQANIKAFPALLSDVHDRMKRELEHNRERDLLKRVYDGIRAGSHYVSLSTEDYEAAVSQGYIERDRKLSKLGAVLIIRMKEGKL